MRLTMLSALRALWALYAALALSALLQPACGQTDDAAGGSNAQISPDGGADGSGNSPGSGGDGVGSCSGGSPGGAGCPCATGACDAGLFCDPATSLCRAASTCASLSCGDHQLCSGGGDGTDATCDAACEPGYNYAQATGSCVSRCDDENDPLPGQCAAAHETCEPGVAGADAHCGGCIAGYIPVGESCVENVTGECTDDHDCKAGQVCGHHKSNPNNTLCADWTCLNDDGSPDEGFAFDAGANECVACFGTCGAGTSGYYSLTAADSHACICATLDGFFYTEANNGGAFPCDADNDGWLRLSARSSMESSDPAISANARCHLRTVDRFVLENDYGQQLPVLLCAQGPEAGVDACESSDPTSLALYETDRNDDDALLQSATATDVPPYGEGGRRPHAWELNGLTRMCASETADYNDDAMPDVGQWHAMPSIGANKLDPTLLQFTYFAEIHEGRYQPGAAGGPGSYLIRERRRCDDADLSLRYAAGHGDYWRSCPRVRPQFDPASFVPGMEFAEWSPPCMDDTAACQLDFPAATAQFTPPVPNDPPTSPMLDLCTLTPEQWDWSTLPWAGMGHAGHFLCASVVSTLATDPVNPAELTVEQVEGRFSHNRCVFSEDSDVAGSAGEVSTPATCGGESSPVEPGVQLLLREFEPAVGAEGLATYAADYEGGCLDEFWTWGGSCQGTSNAPPTGAGYADTINYGLLICCGEPSVLGGPNTCKYNCLEDGQACEEDVGIGQCQGGQKQCTSGTALPAEYACVHAEPQQEAAEFDDLDSNCDGFDGDLASALFVTCAGNDSHEGTLWFPVKSVGRALQLAAASGQPRTIFVATEATGKAAGPAEPCTYQEQGWSIPAGRTVTIRGGWANGWDGVSLGVWQKPDPAKPAPSAIVFSTPLPVTVAKDATLTLYDLTVAGGDYEKGKSYAGDLAKSRSAYGMVVDQGHAELVRVTLTAGKGADYAGEACGTQKKGADGVDGSKGKSGCEYYQSQPSACGPDASCSKSGFFGGGYGVDGALPGSQGGQGGDSACDANTGHTGNPGSGQQLGFNTQGIPNTLPASYAIYGPTPMSGCTIVGQRVPWFFSQLFTLKDLAAGGEGSGACDCGVSGCGDNTPAQTQVGDNGPPGDNAGDGCHGDKQGQVSGAYFVPIDGTAGGQGGDGYGGGGGGGGGGGQCGCNSCGGGGGGGGSGGQGGFGGCGGLSGGASIGVVVNGKGSLTLTESTVIAGAGGTGQAAALGGDGGAPGVGGGSGTKGSSYGGANSQDDARNGGKGGDGGKGGKGGAGGGGAGGPSIGVWLHGGGGTCATYDKALKLTACDAASTIAAGKAGKGAGTSNDGFAKAWLAN